MYVHPKPIIKGFNTRSELDEFFNTFPSAKAQNSYPRGFEDELDLFNISNVASNFPNEDNYSQRQKRIHFQSPQIPISINNPQWVAQPKQPPNVTENIDLCSPSIEDNTRILPSPFNTEYRTFSQPKRTLFRTETTDTDFPLIDNRFETRRNDNRDFRSHNRHEQLDDPFETSGIQNRTFTIENRHEQLPQSQQIQLQNANKENVSFRFVTPNRREQWQQCGELHGSEVFYWADRFI